MTFLEYMRSNKDRLEPCDCGVESGFAHPKSCSSQVSMDVLWKEWVQNYPQGRMFRNYSKEW